MALDGIDWRRVCPIFAPYAVSELIPLRPMVDRTQKLPRAFFSLTLPPITPSFCSN